MTAKPAARPSADPPLIWPDDPEDVTADDIDFEALAHVLANTCRRGGRMRQFHSLAAHAVVVSEEIEALDGLLPEDRRVLALHALIAGAASAWLRDPPSAGPRSADRTGKLAAAVERALREAAGLDAALGEEHAELLRFVDRMAASAESRDLLDGAGLTGSALAFPPCRRRIRPLAPERAARMWLGRFRELRAPDGGKASDSRTDAAPA